MLIEQLSNPQKWTRSEELLIKFIQTYPRLTVNLSLDELSEKCYTSQASILRCCKKLGFKGFSEFKIQLASELSAFALSDEPVSVDMPIAKTDSKADIAKKLFNLSHQALETTYNQLDFAALESAANLLANADIIRIYARGESLVVAEDFHYKLLRMGKLSVLESLAGFQEARAGVPHRSIKEAALVISHYCNSLQVQYNLDELVANNTPFVLLTANNNVGLYSKLAHTTLKISNTESRYKMGSFASRTAMLLTLDCLYGLIFSKNYEQNVENLTKFSKRKTDRTYFYHRQKDNLTG